ncbi:alpha/beta fold hydrolase [Flagellimonas sp. S3867]|uniref:alpha/beta fold hydrolase n=1 Tax=Flagellimonas sp. S3867 TaxID=2768063 RepID=UPI00168620E9|nr:alpha/beta fold hydrolase [Flagellimonas sp. S3867]
MKALQKITPLLLIFFAYQLGIGQELPRKASLGIGVVTLNDSIAEINNLSLSKGVLISRVIPNSTSDALKLVEGDVITSINDTEIMNRSQVFSIARELREGNPIKINIVRNGRAKKVKGKALGKPKELASEGVEVLYRSIQTDFGLLRTIIHKPLHVETSPAIFFLQGIYCGSQDFWAVPTEPLKLLIDDFAKAGYTVYRVERPSMGDSEGEKHCRDLNYAEELAIHKAAYKDFIALPFVNKSELFLFGHSMGSVTAPLLAQDYTPKGVIVYAPVYKTWFEYFLDNFRTVPVHFGVETKEQIDAMVRNSIPLLYQWLIEEKSPEEIRKDPANKILLEQELNAFNYNEGDYFFGRHYSFFSGLNKINNAKTWAKVNTNVLAMYGSSDHQGISVEPAKDIVATVNEIKEGAGTFMEIPEADHVFARVKSKKEGARLILSNEYVRYIRENYHVNIAKKTMEWMEKQRALDSPEG